MELTSMSKGLIVVLLFLCNYAYENVDNFQAGSDSGEIVSKETLPIRFHPTRSVANISDRAVPRKGDNITEPFGYVLSSQPLGQPSLQSSGSPTGQPTMQPPKYLSQEFSIENIKSLSDQPKRHPIPYPRQQPKAFLIDSLSLQSILPVKKVSNKSRRPAVMVQADILREDENAKDSFGQSNAGNKPSGQPSSQPSNQPTGQPSSQPSGQPSGQPSMQPTGQPSGQPSMQPTGQPSGQPSIQPSGNPSNQPTGEPTIQSTRQLTKNLRQQPSKAPSKRPAVQPTFPTYSPASKVVNYGISYQGGPIMDGTANVYLVWYGDWSGSRGSGSGARTQAIIRGFIRNLGGSKWLNIATTYAGMGLNGGFSRVNNALVLKGEVTVKVSARDTIPHWSSVSSIVSTAFGSRSVYDPQGIYLVIPSEDIIDTFNYDSSSRDSCSRYCGWHNSVTINQQNVAYGFITNPNSCTNPISCAQFTSGSVNGNMAGDAMVNLIAHEVVEAMTDPFGNAYITAGIENADMCSWNFGTTANYNMQLGSWKFLIQQNWVNAPPRGYCAIRFPT